MEYFEGKANKLVMNRRNTGEKQETRMIPKFWGLRNKVNNGVLQLYIDFIFLLFSC